MWDDVDFNIIVIWNGQLHIVITSITEKCIGISVITMTQIGCLVILNLIWFACLTSCDIKGSPVGIFFRCKAANLCLVPSTVRYCWEHLFSCTRNTDSHSSPQMGSYSSNIANRSSSLLEKTIAAYHFLLLNSLRFFWIVVVYSNVRRLAVNYSWTLNLIRFRFNRLLSWWNGMPSRPINWFVNWLRLTGKGISKKRLRMIGGKIKKVWPNMFTFCINLFQKHAIYRKDTCVFIYWSGFKGCSWAWRVSINRGGRKRKAKYESVTYWDVPWIFDKMEIDQVIWSTSTDIIRQ